jgi:hypothetical protein
MAWFDQEKMAVEDPTEDKVFSTLYQVISPEEPLMRKLAQKQPSTLHGLLDNVEELINEEETLKAMARSRLHQKIA